MGSNMAAPQTSVSPPISRLASAGSSDVDGQEPVIAPVPGEPWQIGMSLAGLELP